MHWIYYDRPGRTGIVRSAVGGLMLAVCFDPRGTVAQWELGGRVRWARVGLA